MAEWVDLPKHIAPLADHTSQAARKRRLGRPSWRERAAPNAEEEGFDSHLVEREDNSAASLRGKGEIAVVEKSFPSLVSELVESD